MKRSYQEAAARGLILLFCAATSLYCLLCFLPFSWINFIQDRRYPLWVGFFVRGHGLLALAVVALGALALRGRRKRLSWAVAAGIPALAAAMTGWLAARGGNASSLSCAFAAWLAYFVWETFLGVAAQPAPVDPTGPHPGAAVAAAVFCSAAYALGDTSLAAPWSLLAHLELFLIAALLLDALSLAPWALLPAVWFAAAKALVWTLSSLSFTGPAAKAYAGLVTAAAVTAAFRSRAALRDAHKAVTKNWTRRATALCVLAGAPWLARTAFAGRDWNRLFESTAAVAVWLLAGAVFAKPRAASPRRARYALWAAAAAAAALAWHAPRLLPRGGEGDISARTARRLLRRPETSGDLFAFLSAHTNLPKTGAAVRDQELTHSWGPGLAHKPHLFVIVVDSLRPDYLGAYNPRVSFTPAIDAFAREAVVFHRAFAAYGGTGLSEPSIWAGARLPHRQYPAPFSPLNALEKLVDRDGYRPLITMDVVLTELLKPDKRENALDRETYDQYKLCRTLDELDARLDRELATGRPLFVYTQPQDLHVSVIQREGAKPVGPAGGPPFNPPYGSRVAALDACFGRFLDGLKRRGIDEDSVVVLTSDHGDSLGEDGRWGHAYTLFPEVLRVPLIIRVPPRLRSGRYWDPDAAAFLTDLTPTLYALLGHEPDAAGEPFGRPLFEAERAVFATRTRGARVVASSYGPVYGLLRGAGESLSVADGINHATYLFDLVRDPNGGAPLDDPAAEARDQAEIRAQLEALRSYYGY